MDAPSRLRPWASTSRDTAAREAATLSDVEPTPPPAPRLNAALDWLLSVALDAALVPAAPPSPRPVLRSRGHDASRPFDLDGEFDRKVHQWVQCDACQTWRKLPLGMDPRSLPEAWTCTMTSWDASKAALACAASSDGESDEETVNDAEIDHWIECTLCLKWRRLPAGAAVRDGGTWTCAMNPDRAFDRCSVPQQSSSDSEGELDHGGDGNGGAYARATPEMQGKRCFGPAIPVTLTSHSGERVQCMSLSAAGRQLVAWGVVRSRISGQTVLSRRFKLKQAHGIIYGAIRYEFDADAAAAASSNTGSRTKRVRPTEPVRRRRIDERF